MFFLYFLASIKMDKHSKVYKWFTFSIKIVSIFTYNCITKTKAN